MKPRFRHTADGSWHFLTQDGYVPSISIPGDHLTLPSLGHGVPRLPSLNDRQIVIAAPDISLRASTSASTASQRHGPARGHEAGRPPSFEQNNHMSLPHSETLSRSDYPRGQ